MKDYNKMTRTQLLDELIDTDPPHDIMRQYRKQSLAQLISACENLAEEQSEIAAERAAERAAI